MDNTPYVIVPLGVHMLELLKYNPRTVVAALDVRDNGALRRAGIGDLVEQVYSIGPEHKTPLFSVASNKKYYSRVAQILDECCSKYPFCKFVISANYTPFTRFLIDHVGPERVELWEDGLNHYIKLESLLPSYRYKEIAKFLAGFYRGGLFNSDYRGHELAVFDRFKNGNLQYPVVQLRDGESYYIGQPLIEDKLINESFYRQKLSAYFDGKSVNYLPHPREQERHWWHDIFTVIKPNCSAEAHLHEHGASALYSAFSTVNVNVACAKNVFLSETLGLDLITQRLKELTFGPDIH